ncbi:MAG: beta strand repeat-containing protein, partial [Saprospiraceae bacterium]
MDITITPEDDNVVEGDETVTLTLTATASYNLGATTNATVTITDNDLAAVMVSPTMLSLNETGETTGNFTVSLNATPPNNVTIQLVFNSAQLQVNTGSGLGSSPQTITLTPANALSGVTVTVKALDDAIDETDPHSETITALSTSSASSLFNNLSVDDVVVSIADNDAAGVTITQSSGSNTVSENGTTDTYTIRLNSQPTSSVTYEISFPASDVTINGDTDGLFATIFNTGNWNTPQTITIAAVNDRALEGDHTATLTHAFLSTDANYNGATARVDGTTNTNNLTVNITDNETGLVEWNLTAASAAEGANNTPSVRLDITADPIGGTPTLEGTINYTLIQTLGTAEAGDIGTVTGGLSFNNVNDLAANVITITHLTDALVEGTETYTYTIVLGASPTGVTVSGTNFTGTITDANTATVALTGSAIISEAVGTHNGVVTLTTSGGATLESALTFPVNLVSNTAVFSGATGDMYLGTSASPVNTTNVTFPAGSGNGATQNVTININDDRTVEASTSSSTGFNTPENFNVTLGTLPSIVSATTSSITVTIDENDFAYITMTPTFTINDVTDIESNTSRTTNVQVRIIANGTGTEQVQDAFTVPVQSASLGLLNDATPGTDFTAISTTVTFPAGSVNNAQQPVPVTVINDNIDEFYGALSSFNQNREFFDVGFNAPAIRAAYAGVPILIPQSANDNCDGTNGLPNLPGSCRDRSTLIILDNDQANVVVTESGGNTAVVEGGAGDTYTVVLATQPTSNVTVNLSFDQTQVTVNGDTDGATSLIFTTANWATPQNVSVFAVNDVLVEGNPHTSLITQTITSTDLIYNAINPADVTVSITDNDLATIVFANANSNVAETTASHNVTARLDLVTNGSPGGTLSGALTANVDVTLGTAESADFTQTTTQVTFAAGSTNGATQNISFTMANDRLLEGNETFTLGFGTVSGAGSASGSHEVTITDDESGVITFTAASSTAPEGTTPHNVGVQLVISGTGTGNAQVENDVTVAINNTPGTATTPADYTTTSTSVTFASGTNSPISGTVANTIVNDALVEATDENFSLGFGSVTGAGTINATGTHTVTIDENDSATVTFGPGNDTVSEGVGVFNKTVTLTITSNPAGGTLAEALSIAYGADELSATEPEDFTVVGTTIDFAAGSANGTTIQAQVNIIDDLIDEDAEFFEPKLNNNQAVIASAPNITVTPRGLTTVQILDNDVANITVNPTTVAINEDGPTSQNYTVVLTTQPTANVTINLSFDPLQITVNGDTDGALSLTFTTANWNTAQTVTVLAVDDFITEGNHSITITQTVTSA